VLVAGAAGTAAAGAFWPGTVIGAVAGAGGWLVSAPGTPAGLVLPFCDSLVCWLRMAMASGVWFGL